MAYQEQEIHPDLAAIFAAGDAILPDHILEQATPPIPARNANGKPTRTGVTSNAFTTSTQDSAPSSQQHTPGDNEPFWSLGNLLTLMFRHAIDKSDAAERAPVPPVRKPSSHNNHKSSGPTTHDNHKSCEPTTHDDQTSSEAAAATPVKTLVTTALGDGVSWGEGTLYVPDIPSPPEDMSLMLLGPYDFPSMRPAPVYVKLGNRLPKPDDPEAEFTCDRHRPFCDPLLELSTELTDFWGVAPAMMDTKEGSKESTQHHATTLVQGRQGDGDGEGGDNAVKDDDGKGFPMYVRDFRYVFESADGASRYLKRSWRYLTENWVPELTTPSESTTTNVYPSTEALYATTYKQPRPALVEGVGAEAQCYQMPTRGVNGNPDRSTIRGREGVAVGASIICVFRVGPVVVKTCIASRNESLPRDIVRKALLNVVGRIERWCAAKSVPKILQSLPPDVRSFRDDFMQEWRQGVEHVLTWPKPAKSICYGQAPCQVCQQPGAHRRCSGCRGFTYCGEACQHRHWTSGHKKDCTFEFQTRLQPEYDRWSRKAKATTSKATSTL
eukprot:m.166350 g.166350  ORF g.166350 m.166350 type:complete len:553 (+) comp12679_c0_seq1:243-1901(+)